MHLPILQSGHSPTHGNLLRLFYQTDARWADHLAEPEPLAVGTAYANPGLARVHNANHIRDAALPQGMPLDAAVRLVQDHFSARGVRCFYWVMNPSAAESSTQPLVEHLLATGHRAVRAEVLRLEHAPRTDLPGMPGLMIIPARASFAHYRALAEEVAARFIGEPQIAEAAMLHLDDPHWDALLAMKDGIPAGRAGVLAVGEVGRIEHVYVAEAFRRQGIGQILMQRIIEICARSLFKHVMLSVAPDNEPALNLYRRLGFVSIGQSVAYYADDARP